MLSWYIMATSPVLMINTFPFSNTFHMGSLNEHQQYFTGGLGGYLMLFDIVGCWLLVVGCGCGWCCCCCFYVYHDHPTSAKSSHPLSAACCALRLGSLRPSVEPLKRLGEEAMTAMIAMVADDIRVCARVIKHVKHVVGKLSN